MDMNTMWKLEEMCCKEVEKITQRGELTASALEQAAMLVDTIKDIYTIDAMEDGNDYSQDGSYASRRGTHYVRAHYSRDGGYARGGNGTGVGNTGGGGSSYGRDSRGRYSRADEKDDMIRRMERMMEQSNDPGEAEAYQRAMDQLRNA